MSGRSPGVVPGLASRCVDGHVDEGGNSATCIAIYVKQVRTEAFESVFGSERDRGSLSAPYKVNLGPSQGSCDVDMRPAM